MAFVIFLFRLQAHLNGAYAVALPVGRPGQTPTRKERITDRSGTERFCDSHYDLEDNSNIPRGNNQVGG